MHLGRIRSVQIELHRHDPCRQFGLAGNPGAPSSAVRIAELRLSCPLPPTYRQFLQFTNGWPAFYCGADLLGTAEVGRPACLHPNPSAAASTLDPLRNILEQETLVPFGASSRGDTLFCFDAKAPSCTGELPVVAWIGGLGLECRNFTEFLATVLQLCRSENSDLTTAESHRSPVRKVLRRRPRQCGAELLAVRGPLRRVG